LLDDGVAICSAQAVRAAVGRRALEVKAPAVGRIKQAAQLGPRVGAALGVDVNGRPGQVMVLYGDGKLAAQIGAAAAAAIARD
jgi:hypothetical protein